MTSFRPSSSALVIGGGVIGLFTAWRLRQAGFAVTLVERDHIGGSASWAAGGIVCPLPPWQAPSVVWALAAESIQAYPDIAAGLHEATGIDPQYLRSGMSVRGEAAVDAALQWAHAQGMAVQKRVDDGGHPLLHLPWVAQLRSPRLLKALMAQVQLCGVRCLPHTAVTGFDAVGGQVRAVLMADGSRHAADVVVLCAGAWSGVLAAPLSVALPVQAVRGQMLLYQAPPGMLTEIILQGAYYLIPRQDGCILVGSTLEPVGFDARTTQQAHDQLNTQACALLPALKHCAVSQHWAALRPGSHQGIPSIARASGLHNLFIHTGHYRNGITLAPASTARLVALVCV